MSGALHRSADLLRWAGVFAGLDTPIDIADQELSDEVARLRGPDAG